MRYQNYKYIYPCRPANAVTPDDLELWDNGSMFAQLKFNGSNTLIFTNGDIVRVMGRHSQSLSNFAISKEEIINSIYRPLNINGNWLVINGETLNKSKRDENGQVFNQKLVLFDILVHNSDYLLGKTFQERAELLQKLWVTHTTTKDYLLGISENIFLAKSYMTDFKELFNEYTKIDMIEGLVLKRKNARLESGTTEKNNWRSQIKVRKPTLNYKY
jgi:ATP-dependent DNA ligase